MNFDALVLAFLPAAAIGIIAALLALLLILGVGALTTALLVAIPDRYYELRHPLMTVESMLVPMIFLVLAFAAFGTVIATGVLLYTGQVALI